MPRDNIDFLYGSELTALWRGREIHIVGCASIPTPAALKDHLHGVLQQRIERVRAIGAKLTRAGLAGEAMVAEVLELQGTPTRLHLASLLVARGHAKDVDAAFERWLGTGKRAARARAVAGHRAGHWRHPGRRGTRRCWPIRTATSSLAGALSELCRQFREAGGAGIEVSLPGLSPKDAARAASLARRFDLAGSCASDFHAPGLPWRPLGRFAKLPEGIVPITERLGLASPGTAATTSHAPPAP